MRRSALAISVSGRPTIKRVGFVVLALVAGVIAVTGPARAGGEPPGIDPGEPTFTGSSTPIPAEPVGYRPGTSMLRSIYEADLRAGGTSFWFDRILARPYSPDDDTALMTRGRALYMYTHN